LKVRRVLGVEILENISPFKHCRIKVLQTERLKVVCIFFSGKIFLLQDLGRPRISYHPCNQVSGTGWPLYFTCFVTDKGDDKIELFLAKTLDELTMTNYDVTSEQNH
jgi:hypothetical protein